MAAPGLFCEERAREEDHELVAPDDLAVRVDGAEAVRVAVVGDADARARLLHATDEGVEVLRDGRVGVVVRERPVHVAEEGVGGEAHGAQRGEAERAARAVAGVDDEGEGPFEGDGRPRCAPRSAGATSDRFDLAGARRAEARCRDELAESLDVLAEEARLAPHHLEAVVLGGVVAPGDHDTAVDFERVDGEVEERRRSDADVDDVGALRGEPGDQRGVQARAREPAVSPQGQPRSSARLAGRASCRAPGRCPWRLHRTCLGPRRRGCRTHGR